MKGYMTDAQSVDSNNNQYSHFNYLRTRKQINFLVAQHLSINILNERLADLPTQFESPHQRHWAVINWKEINLNQIIGVNPELFINLVASATEVEAPIREYAKESWNYLQQAHNPMARFLGGTLAVDGSIMEVGVWEKEERQHRPALSKIYQQLTGEKLQIQPNSVAGYQSSGNLQADVYKHAISRITTEWSASAIYLWLMAHSTGELQKAIAQLLQDEVNHLAKFWGMSRWAFGDSFITRLQSISKNLFDLLKHHQHERSTSNDVFQFSYALHAVEIAFTLTRVLVQLHHWNQSLNNNYLEQLFGERKQLALV